MTNRRTFLALGASAAAASAAGVPTLAGAQLTPTCTQPWPAGTTPTPWSAPYGQTTINRISAYDPSYNWTRLKKAYAAMRALPASDPRSLAAQQNVHAWYCQTCMGEPPPNDIHGRWTFFVWHRAFLYFHERILGLLAGDTTLRLPYWDWENAAHQNLPPQYYQGSLNDTTRELQPGHSVQRALPCCGGWFINLVTTVPPEIGLDFTGIGGDATSSGDVETGPHGYVHMSVGGANGDMGNLETAAGDPIFFAHHGNVDRLWYSWEQVSGNVDPAGLSSIPPFAFYDGTKWRTMSASQMIPTTHIGYAYDTKVNPPLKFRVKFPILLQQNRVLKPLPPEQVRAVAASPEVAVSLSHVEFTGTGAFTVVAKTATGSHVVGTFFVVPHGKHAMDTTHSANVRFVVPAATAQALTQPGTTVHLSHAAGLRLTAGVPAPAKLQGMTLSVR
jgi:hypothetical protein